MEQILLVVHTEADGSLPRAALEAVTAVRELAAGLTGGAWSAGLVGGDVQAAAGVLAGSGARRFLGVSGPECASSRYASDAPAVEALCREARATLVVAPGTSRLNRVLPGVAHRLGGRVDTHVTGLTAEGGSVRVTRWYYRQRMEATLGRAERPWAIGLDPGCQAPWQGAPGTAAVEAVPVAFDPAALRTRVVGTQAPPADSQTIRPEADLLFVAGAGWTKKQGDGQTHAADAERLILDVLRLTRCSLGSSKSLVDLRGEGQAVLPFLSHLNQVGQTGSTPRHPKGLATCCHGEEPHAVGWRFIGERRAVNLDPNCGWARGKADVLYVADAFAVIAELNARLAAGTTGQP